MRGGIAALAAALLLLAPPAAALAQCPKTSVADLEDEVMCQVCGTPLALATEVPQAQREREFILGLVEQCKSKDEIKAALVTEYGPSVLALPKAEGFALAAYLVPILGVVLAGAGIGVAAVRWRRRRPAPQRSVETGGPGEADRDAAAARERLDRDLARYDL